MNNNINTNSTSTSISSDLFINATEVSNVMGISRSRAYKIVRSLNDELKKNGFITISGKVSRKYFMERIAQ